MKDSYDRETNTLAVYVSERIKKIQIRYKLSVSELAVMMDYEPASLHRVLKGASIPRAEKLLNLSAAFNISMDFWFPQKNSKSVKIPPPSMDVVCADSNFLTRKIANEINGIEPAIQKKLLDLLRTNQEQIRLAVELATILSSATPKAKEVMIRLLTDFAAQTTVPKK